MHKGILARLLNNGQKVLWGTMKKGSEVSVKTLSPRIYFLFLNQNDQVWVSKFVKN